MLTNPTTWYAGSRYVRVEQRGVKRDVLVPFHQPAQDAEEHTLPTYPKPKTASAPRICLP